MSVFMNRGTLNQADLAYRDKANRQSNYINYAENKPSVNQDCPASPELASLAEKMISDCYSQQKPSEEIMQDFLIEIKNLREHL